MLCVPTSSVCLDSVDDELLLLQNRLQSALTKLSLAKQLLHASTRIPSPDEKYDYVSACLPHGHDRVLHHEFGLDAAGVRLWCINQASGKGERWLRDGSAVKTTLVTAHTEKGELWWRYSHTPHTNNVSVPPMWARRYVIQTLGTTCVWHHPKSLCTASHFAINPQWLDTSTCSAPTVVDYVYLDVTRILDEYPAQWVWCISEQSPCDSLSCVASASFAGTLWYLHATREALEKTTPLQKLRIYTHFRIQHKGRCRLWSTSEYHQLLCNSYSQAIQNADSESNLGRWAELLEYRIPHLPFQRNPLLRMIRASSHIHNWSLSTLVHGHVVYVIFHVHLFCLYTGRTDCALVEQLRKQLDNRTVWLRGQPIL